MAMFKKKTTTRIKIEQKTVTSRVTEHTKEMCIVSPTGTYSHMCVCVCVCVCVCERERETKV
jgi:hypothetical protein